MLRPAMIEVVKPTPKRRQSPLDLTHVNNQPEMHDQPVLTCSWRTMGLLKSSEAV